MLAFLTAMQSEADALRTHLTEEHISLSGGVTFYEGKVGDTPVVIAKSGVGKINAAHTATLLIMLYQPKGIIDSGVAGGLNVSKPMDVVVASALCQHDFDTTPCGDPKGFIDGLNRVFLETDENLTKRLLKCLPTARIGIVASGDQFICDSEIANRIHAEFGAIACEMEGVAIAQVAAMHGVPFAAYRVISDGGNDGAEVVFSRVALKAATLSGEIMNNLLQKTENGEDDF